MPDLANKIDLFTWRSLKRNKIFETCISAIFNSDSYDWNNKWALRKNAMLPFAALPPCTQPSALVHAYKLPLPT